MMLQYRAAAVAGLVTQVVFGLIMVMAYTAFYENSAGPHPLSLTQVITYVWLGQATIRLIIQSGDGEVQQMVDNGTVAYELLKPVDLYNFWYSRAMAGLIAPVMLRAVPMFVVASLFLGLGPPASAAAGLLWLASLGLAFVLGAAVSTLLTIGLLWTISGAGLNRLAGTFIWLLSGIVIPLPLLPQWAKAVVYVLPFRGMLDTPNRLYMGDIAPSDALPVFGHQLLWIVALVLLGRWLLTRAKRKLVVQGG
jgi:ABC-2 type transport system permease protein